MIQTGRHTIIPSFMSVRVRAPRSAAVPWYLSGGIAAANCQAAYTPKAAASLAASYDNNAAPANGLADGTYDAALGVAPTHNPLTGWTFNGTNQYLTTGVTPASGWSMIIRYSGASYASAFGVLVGSRNTIGNRRFYLAKNPGPVQLYANGGGSVGSAFNVVAVVAIAGQQGYRSGVADGGATAAWDTPNNGVIIFIGCYNKAGPADFMAGGFNILALAIYDTVLTAPQVLAVSTAMAAL